MSSGGVEVVGLPAESIAHGELGRPNAIRGVDGEGTERLPPEGVGQQGVLPGKGKLESRGQEGIFLGYSRELKAYRVWFLGETKLQLRVDDVPQVRRRGRR